MAEMAAHHNMEVAHRLLFLEGKCQQIHGHSMQVHLSLYGGISPEGYFQTELGTYDQGDVKKIFRRYIDTKFDHHLLLNEKDPWAKVLQDVDQHNASGTLPGLVTLPGDPSTENLCLWIAEWAAGEFCTDVTVTIDETKTNSFSVDWKYTNV